MNVTHKAVSAYRLKMQECLRILTGQGINQITQEGLANCMNVRVNASFRRHISEMQTDGLVTRYTYQSPRGGYKVAYQFHVQS